jgi:hypothetical protein
MCQNFKVYCSALYGIFLLKYLVTSLLKHVDYALESYVIKFYSHILKDS